MIENSFHILIRDVCEELGVKIEILSYGWIIQLSKNGKVKYITGRKFDLNTEATGEIVCDKYATFEVLKSMQIPIIEHVMVFNPATRASYISNKEVEKLISEEFKKHDCLVVKPNNGCEGQGVSLCYSKREVEECVKNLFKVQNSVSICPYYNIKTEYRTFYFDGKVYLIYGKTKPYVIGNGYSTLGELIEKLDLPNKNVVQENLNKLDLSYIPAIDEKVNISWKHNLSGGAIPTILPKCELYDKIENLAILAGKSMNISFATIDIIETIDNNLYVLEINSGIGATIFTEKVEGGYEIMKNIYKKAINKMFKEKI